MALMYPRTLPTDQDLLDDGLRPLSSAERRLFEAFKHGVSDDYTVFHGCNLHNRDKRYGALDKEIDFLVVHPTMGVLALEVKGGRIVVDGKSGLWVSVDRHGEPHEIKNPVKQVRDAVYALLDVLRADATLRHCKLSVWYGVALPDVDFDQDLALDAPRAILFDRGDSLSDRLEAALERTYRYYGTGNGTSLPKAGMAALTALLAPNWVLRPLTRTDIVIEDTEFIRLTEEQYAVLDGMDHKPRALIAGCAGSGKTMLAVEKARRLGAAGHRVLLTCYNKGLANWLNATYPMEGVTIRHFHSLAKQTIEAVTGHTMPMHDALGLDEAYYWSHYVPSQLYEVCDRVPQAERFDAIVVDEGQDFLEGYWIPLQLLGKDPDGGIFYIFYDDSQRIYTNDAFPLPEIAFRLTRNLRSTYEIGETVARYYRGSGAMRPAGPVSKRPPEIVKSRKGEPPEELLRRILDKVTAEGIALHDVALLTVHNTSSRWANGLAVGPYKLVRTNRELKSNEVAAASIYAFKGLERPVIILAELQELDMSAPEDVMLLYVALSRAKNQLFVLGELPELSS